jgi:hypothetical protein
MNLADEGAMPGKGDIIIVLSCYIHKKKKKISINETSYNLAVS